MPREVIPIETANLVPDTVKALGEALAAAATPHQNDLIALKQSGATAKCAEHGCLTELVLAAQKEANKGSYWRAAINGLRDLGKCGVICWCVYTLGKCLIQALTEQEKQTTA